MRKVLALGAAILFVGSVSVAVAQERLQSNQSGLGVGEGVGDVSGSSTRVNTFDRTNFLERLSQAETVYGRVLGVDIPGRKLHLESGGSSHDEGRAGGGPMSFRTIYFDDNTNMDQIRILEAGDDIVLQLFEDVSGSGRKLVRELSLRGSDRLAKHYFDVTTQSKPIFSVKPQDTPRVSVRFPDDDKKPVPGGCLFVACGPPRPGGPLPGPGPSTDPGR
jgi:hypothetical protein